jgi:hypothetical protein
MGFECKMKCETIYGGQLRYGKGNCWCRTCDIAIMIDRLIIIGNNKVLRCPCCHQRVRFKSRDPEKYLRRTRKSGL